MTIYLCKSYNGGSFWSDTLCSQQRATIDRMTTVPSDLSFEQQVAIARAQASEAARLYLPPVPSPAAAVGPSAERTVPDGLCATLNREREALDAWARSPQSGQTQDWIRHRRMEVQAQRVAHRC